VKAGRAVNRGALADRSAMGKRALDQAESKNPATVNPKRRCIRASIDRGPSRIGEKRKGGKRRCGEKKKKEPKRGGTESSNALTIAVESRERQNKKYFHWKRSIGETENYQKMSGRGGEKASQPLEATILRKQKVT